MDIYVAPYVYACYVRMVICFSKGCTFSFLRLCVSLVLQKPYIEVEIKDPDNVRSRRMAGLECDERSAEPRCCRYQLEVDFEAFGWDWIIAPKRYQAYYCSGECPFVFMIKYLHGHLAQQSRPKGSSGPCCSPSKMSSISMLYFDESSNIVYGTLPSMVVDKCGCA